MKVKVKLEIGNCWFSSEPNSLTILYKTSWVHEWKKIPLLCNINILGLEQTPFIEQLEEFVSQGNVKERICAMVKMDIVENIENKKWEKVKDNRLQELLIQIPDKITFEFDENKYIK